jgi:hypothetical protein
MVFKMVMNRQQWRLEETVRDAKMHLLARDYAAALDTYQRFDPEDDARIAHGIAASRLLLAREQGTLDLDEVDNVIDLYHLSLQQEDDPFTQAELGRTYLTKLVLLARDYTQTHSPKCLYVALMATYKAEEHLQAARVIYPMAKAEFDANFNHVQTARRGILEELGSIQRN